MAVVLNRASDVKNPLCREVCGMCFFWRSITTERNTTATGFDTCGPPPAILFNTKQSACAIAIGILSILSINNSTNIPQILEPVVKPVAVDVVYASNWPMTCNNSPSHSMHFVLPRVNAKLPISMPIEAAGFFANKHPIAGRGLPTKYPCSFVVSEKPSQFSRVDVHAIGYTNLKDVTQWL